MAAVRYELTKCKRPRLGPEAEWLLLDQPPPTPVMRRLGYAGRRMGTGCGCRIYDRLLRPQPLALAFGQMSLLYFALSATLHNLIWDMQKTLPGTVKGFKAADFTYPALTIFALEEPENHLSPFYLPRLMALLDTLNASGAAQSIVTSHATSILSRVNPKLVLYFRIGTPTKPVNSH